MGLHQELAEEVERAVAVAGHSLVTGEAAGKAAPEGLEHHVIEGQKLEPVVEGNAGKAGVFPLLECRGAVSGDEGGKMGAPVRRHGGRWESTMTFSSPDIPSVNCRVERGWEH